MAIANLKNCNSNPFSSACLTEDLFNAMTHLDRKMNCDPKLEIDYRKVVSDQIINCGKERSDLTEIMSLFGAMEPKEVKATELWQRILCNKNYNVYAAANVTGADGASVVLTFAPVSHANSGQSSYVEAGFELYHYRTQQTYTVTAVTKTAAFAHTAQIVSYENKAADIKAGDAFFVTSSRAIGKSACSIAPSSLLRETGYLIKSSPLRIEESYCFKTAVDDFGQSEVYQFPLLDDNGQVHQYWEPWIKSQKRLSMERSKSLKFLLGSKITNPNHPLFGDEFSGFDGYINRIKYGGGNYHPIALTGITVAHLDMVEQAARGFGITEFTWIMPWQQRKNAERNMDALFSSSAGSCTFESFERSGNDNEDVRKLGIKSLTQNGFTHHFKTAKWADYEDLLGNDFLKNAIFVTPSARTTDIYGKPVPTFEFLKPIGMAGVDKSYFEMDDDGRTRTPFCEEINGVMRQVLWMRINCINNHWMFEPKSGC